jgi:hypothetical protein
MGMTAGCIREIDTAQNTYIPMIVQGNQWNELHLNISVPPGYQYARTYITKIGNDTVIDGVQYYKLLTASDSLSSDWQANGCIRENAVEQKIYYKPENKPELLLYAFDVHIGDTWETYDYRFADNFSVTVTNIDYVNINGTMHKQIFISTTYENNLWIEGIGGLNGLLNSYQAVNPPGSDGISLSCFYKNSELTYKPNETEECFVWETDFSEFWE